MSGSNTPSNLAYDGRTFRIEFVETRPGKMPAREFLEGKKLNRGQRFGLIALIEKLGDEGEIPNPKNFNHEKFGKKHGIWALKIWKRRVYCFRDGDSWKLTNGCKKSAQKADPKELERAYRIREDYLHLKRG